MPSPQNQPPHGKSHKHDNDPAKDPVKSGSERDEANKERFIDQTGREASELPHGGRPTGYNDTIMDVANRNPPDLHGGTQLNAKGTNADDFTGRNDGGLRGDRALGDADIHGGRGKN